MASTERMTIAAYRALPATKKGRKVPIPKAPDNVAVFEPQPDWVAGARYCFVYSGQGISSNVWYAGMHWRKRKKLVEKYHALLLPLIVASGIQPMRHFRVGLCYHSACDVDNTSALLKTCIDLLKGKYVPDDSPQYLKSISIEYSPGLPLNTYVFTITELL